ncbi:unnamed protein product [Fraxinus pennsylvanica]|uniref:Uncharacterized protein n=1 Tax=Fraxinus pennsylvanica TaxID=56036 RepID=A0AAD2AH33_9LAMI|nr:unnamed protein product [Fraxinus pennsylvanica]
MSINQALGYPKAYAKIRGDPSFRSFSHGPPFTFTPYSLPHQEPAEDHELQQKTDEEKASIQELELVLIKRRRRAEKCRRLAEAQTSYRAMLEKMIRDAMHQSVVYKEQVRLNQATTSALLARLEAQKAICNSAERELHRKYKLKDELEKRTRPERNRQGRDQEWMIPFRKRKMKGWFFICQKTRQKCNNKLR